MENQTWKVSRYEGDFVFLINELGDEIRISRDFFNAVFKGDVKVQVERIG